ncbi:MAG: cytochrome P460 family protein [Candidatus Kapabacteria bacterium]|nr:cytochrome P460 family protein [Candidatus Kapabacteria bacterium]
MTMRSFWLATAAAASLAFGSCAKETTTTAPATEFVATDANFSGYATWTQTTTPRRGPDPALGAAHEGNDTNVTRYMYINSATASRSNNGQYPNGTIIVKEMKRNGANFAVMGMVKRGGEFNKDHNGWEWVMLSNDGKIQDRGANLMGGMCNGCHSGVKSTKDYVFTKN